MFTALTMDACYTVLLHLVVMYWSRVLRQLVWLRMREVDASHYGS